MAIVGAVCILNTCAQGSIGCTLKHTKLDKSVYVSAIIVSKRKPNVHISDEDSHLNFKTSQYNFTGSIHIFHHKNKRSFAKLSNRVQAYGQGNNIAI